MNEEHFREIETVMLYLGEAHKRAVKAQKVLAKKRADSHLVEALKRVEGELAETKRSFIHGTYYAAENYVVESVAEQLPLS